MPLNLQPVSFGESSYHCWCILLFLGDPAQCNAWAGQCGLYILVMIIEKTLMTLLVLFDFWKKVSCHPVIWEIQENRHESFPSVVGNLTKHWVVRFVQIRFVPTDPSALREPFNVKRRMMLVCGLKCQEMAFKWHNLQLLWLKKFRGGPLDPP